MVILGANHLIWGIEICFQKNVTFDPLGYLTSCKQPEHTIRTDQNKKA